MNIALGASHAADDVSTGPHPRRRVPIDPRVGHWRPAYGNLASAVDCDFASGQSRELQRSRGRTQR